MMKRATKGKLLTALGLGVFVGSLALNPIGTVFWVAAVGVGLLLWGWLGREGRRARVERGQCEHCGYDLRGTRGRCPECGRLVAPGTPVGRG